LAAVKRAGGTLEREFDDDGRARSGYAAAWMRREAEEVLAKLAALDAGRNLVP
jgi:hypothetical protein